MAALVCVKCGAKVRLPKLHANDGKCPSCGNDVLGTKKAETKTAAKAEVKTAAKTEPKAEVKKESRSSLGA